MDWSGDDLYGCLGDYALQSNCLMWLREAKLALALFTAR